MTSLTQHRLEVASLAAALSLGIGFGSAQFVVGSKLDTARFVADSITRAGSDRAREARSARADSLLIEVQGDVRVMLCDQYPRYPKCRGAR